MSKQELKQLLKELPTPELMELMELIMEVTKEMLNEVIDNILESLDKEFSK